MADKTMISFYPLTEEELQASCRDDEVSNHENEGHRAVEKSQIAKHHQEYGELITKVKAISDKMITSHEPDIIRGCVKEMQMNAPNGDFAQLCEAFFTGDSMRVDLRREIFKLYEDFKRQQIMADIELVAKKHNMPVDELMELITESEED